MPTPTTIDYACTGAWSGDCAGFPSSGTLTLTGDCLWTQTTGGVEVSLSLIDLTWTLVFTDGVGGNATYDLTVAGLDCCSAFALEALGGSCVGVLTAPESCTLTPACG